MTRLKALISMEKPEAPPEEIQIIPYGPHETDKGGFVLEGEDMERIVEDFDSRANDMVIDYEHQSLSGGEAPAAGWIRRLFSITPHSPLNLMGDEGGLQKAPGIWAVVQWNERAREYLENREYRYLSPVFLKRLSDNRVVKLLGAALTNTPAIDGMVPVVNKEDSRGQGAKGSRFSLEPTDPGTLGPYNKTRKEARGMKKVLSALGLTAGATEEEALKALYALKAGGEAAASPAVLLELGLAEGAGESEVLGAVAAMRQGAESLRAAQEEVLELRARLSKGEAEELVASAMKAGKITPAQGEWALSYAGRDPEGFKVFVARAPEVVPKGELKALTPGAPSMAADGIQLSVNRLLMVSDETFRKHSKKEQGDT